MKLKSKSFNLMERTDALLKMLATAKGVIETEIIEDALEQFADKNILNFINAMYGKKTDRDTVRADRKRNSKNKKKEKKEKNVVLLEKEKNTEEVIIKNNDKSSLSKLSLSFKDDEKVLHLRLD